MFYKRVVSILLLIGLLCWADPSAKAQLINHNSELEIQLFGLIEAQASNSWQQGVLLDNRLCRCAKKYNEYSIQRAQTVIDYGYLKKLLNQNNIYEYTMPILILKKNEVDYKKILNSPLLALIKREKFNALGLSIIPGSPRDSIMLLLGRQYIQLAELPEATTQTACKISGKLIEKFYNLKLLVKTPEGKVAEYPLSMENEFLEYTYKFSGSAGQYIFQIIGDDNYGPNSLAIFAINYNYFPAEQEQPASGNLADEKIYSVQEATEYLARMINQERSKHSLPELKYNPKLAALAKQHSDEMSKFAYFSHGDLQQQLTYGQRWQAAGLAFTASAENIARGWSVDGIWSSMLDRPWDFRNILDPALTEYGVGTAIATDLSGKVYYFVTQEFINTDQTERYSAELQQTLQIINSRRETKNLPPLIYAKNQAWLAQKHAEAMAEADTLAYSLNGGQHLAEKYRQQIGANQSTVSIYAAKELSAIDFENIYNPEFSRIAIGYCEAESKRFQGQTKWVVVVLIN